MSDDNRTNGKMVGQIYGEMQKGYDDNQAEVVVINNGRLDPEWSTVYATRKR